MFLRAVLSPSSVRVAADYGVSVTAIPLHLLLWLTVFMLQVETHWNWLLGVVPRLLWFACKSLLRQVECKKENVCNEEEPIKHQKCEGNRASSVLACHWFGHSTAQAQSLKHQCATKAVNDTLAEAEVVRYNHIKKRRRYSTYSSSSSTTFRMGAQ